MTGKAAEAPRPPRFKMITHTEFASLDPKATRRFFEKVFGWKFQERPVHGDTYHTFRAPDWTGGGVRTTEPEEAPGATPYVEVESIEATQRLIEKAGGRVILPRVEVDGQGAFIWCQAPGGPVVACWETTNWEAAPPPWRRRSK